MRKKFLLFSVFFLLVLVFSPFFLALAQEDRELEVDYPEISDIKPETVSIGVLEYLKYIFNFSIIILGIVVFSVLVFSGFTYLGSAGDPAKMNSAREGIFSALLGVVILLSSYLILTTINPQLVVFDLPSLIAPIKELIPLPEFGTDEASVIYYEIPLGQMIKNGVWQESEIALMTNADKTGLIDELEKFLREETTIGGRTSNTVADLQKYLKTLLEDCRCDELTAVCTTPQNFADEVGCTGDPCAENREKIKEILTENEKKIEQLEQFKSELIEKVDKFLDEEDNFFSTKEKFSECLENGFILSQGDYLQSVRYYEEQGIKTEVVQSYIPSRGDPFTFYCTVGGTLLDIPVRASDLPEIPSSDYADLPTTALGEFEPLSCPGVIPVGEILDSVSQATVSSNDNLTGLTELIDGLTAEIRNMADLTSEFNEQNCKANCKCFPNPCYTICGGPAAPCASCPLFSLCLPFCASPCLQSVGTCEAKNPDAPYYGYPGPIGDPEEPITENSIEKTVERIKKQEDVIFEFINGLKAGWADTPYVAETPQQLSVDLVEGVRWVASFCKNENLEDPKWALMNCSLALGNIGPDGKQIGGCHLQDFFCCTADAALANSVKTGRPASGAGATYYTPVNGGANYSYQSPVASDGTCNQRILEQASKYIGIRYSQGRASDPFDCQNWSKGHCYPIFDGKGPYLPYSPVTAARNMCVDCSGFASRIYRDLGIIPLNGVSEWCRTVTNIIENRTYFYEIRSPNDVLPGDLITTGRTRAERHIMIFTGVGDLNSSYEVWHSGGCGGASKVCKKMRNYASSQRYFRRVYECDTFSTP